MGILFHFTPIQMDLLAFTPILQNYLSTHAHYLSTLKKKKKATTKKETKQTKKHKKTPNKPILTLIITKVTTKSYKQQNFRMIYCRIPDSCCGMKDFKEKVVCVC